MKPHARPLDVANMAWRLQGLKKGEHYNLDLTPTGKERHMFGTRDRGFKDSVAKKILSEFSGMVQRDFYIDMKNPQQMLPADTKAVDQGVPAFAYPPGSYFMRGDDALKNQIKLAIDGRMNYAQEEQKFDTPLGLSARENSLEPQPAWREGDRIDEYRKQRALALQEQQDMVGGGI